MLERIVAKDYLKNADCNSFESNQGSSGRIELDLERSPVVAARDFAPHRQLLNANEARFAPSVDERLADIYGFSIQGDNSVLKSRRGHLGSNDRGNSCSARSNQHI